MESSERTRPLEWNALARASRRSPGCRVPSAGPNDLGRSRIYAPTVRGGTFTPDAEPDDTGTIDRQTAHDLLASERRRHVLGCLATHGRLALPDLADEVAERERDAPLPQIPEDEVLTTSLSLYHAHVPKLERANVVSYDQDRDVVALADAADALDATLGAD